MALGRSACEAEASVRLSIGLHTTNEEISEAVKIIEQTIYRLRK